MPADQTSPSLPVRALTLDKHGVAFVERGGQISGDAVSLQLRAAEERLSTIDERLDALQSDTKQRQAAIEASLANLATE